MIHALEIWLNVKFPNIDYETEQINGNHPRLEDLLLTGVPNATEWCGYNDTLQITAGELVDEEWVKEQNEIIKEVTAKWVEEILIPYCQDVINDDSTSLLEVHKSERADLIEEIAHFKKLKKEYKKFLDTQKQSA